MATSFSIAEVLEAIQEEEWEDSEERFVDDNEQEEDAIVIQDPLNIAQCSIVISRYHSREPEHDSTMNEEVSNEEPTVDLQNPYLQFPLLLMELHQFLYLLPGVHLQLLPLCCCCYCYIYIHCY